MDLFSNIVCFFVVFSRNFLIFIVLVFFLEVFIFFKCLLFLVFFVRDLEDIVVEVGVIVVFIFVVVVRGIFFWWVFLGLGDMCFFCFLVVIVFVCLNI